MSRSASALSQISAAIGLVIGLQAAPAFAADMDKDMGMSKPAQETMEKMKAHKLEKCYGINAVGKNDCAEGAHSCAGQATAARDPKSFVLLPAGDCSKIEGGKGKPS